jgi:hypothetical protein
VVCLRSECFLLGNSNLNSLRTLLALLDLKLDPLTLFERPVASDLDLRLMHKQIGWSVIRHDETEPLIAVKPLDYACTHDASLSNSRDIHSQSPQRPSRNCPGVIRGQNCYQLNS